MKDCQIPVDFIQGIEVNAQFQYPSDTDVPIVSNTFWQTGPKTQTA